MAERERVDTGNRQVRVRGINWLRGTREGTPTTQAATYVTAWEGEVPRQVPLQVRALASRRRREKDGAGQVDVVVREDRPPVGCAAAGCTSYSGNAHPCTRPNPPVGDWQRVCIFVPVAHHFWEGGPGGVVVGGEGRVHKWSFAHPLACIITRLAPRWNAINVTSYA